MRGQKGFTLVEVIVGAAILSLVLLASGQSIAHLMQTIREAEKKQSAFEESQDLIMYIRRTSKNLSLSRLHRPETYLQNGTSIQSLGPNPPPPADPPSPSLVINVQRWLSSPDGNPLLGKAQAAFPQSTRQIVLNSFVLEEHALEKVSNSLQKKTRRLLVSRCDLWANEFSVATTRGSPGVTALYVLGAMPRRPFLALNSAGHPVVRCCEVNSPNCGDGGIQRYFFRSYAITLNDAQDVIAVDEFPKVGPNNPAMGAGFGLYFANAAGTNVGIQTFTLANQCHLRSMSLRENCKERDPEEFMKKAATEAGLLKVDTRSISTSISNDILNTGVISL